MHKLSREARLAYLIELLNKRFRAHRSTVSDIKRINSLRIIYSAEKDYKSGFLVNNKFIKRIK
jgi:hypothetical protein